MKFVYTEKDIIAFNQLFHQGHMINGPSLRFALRYAQKTENWVKALAWVVRALLVDHIFEDGNKRTAALLIISYADFEGYDVFADEIPKIIKQILLKNITSTKKIEDLLKNVIKQNC